MVRAPRARNIFPARLSIFRPLSPPHVGGETFLLHTFECLSGPGSAEMTAPARSPPPPRGIRGVRALGGAGARGCPPGAARSLRASAAPLRAADFDPPGRTAPALGGPRGSRGGGGHADPARPGRGPRGAGRALFAGPSAGGVGVAVGACIAGWGWGAPGRRDEHRKEAGSIRGGAGRRGPLRRPAVERARKNFCPPPAGPIFFLREFWGFPPPPPIPGSSEGGVGTGESGPGAPHPRPPRPLPARGLLGNCELNGC